jgi:hypothetical protein
MPSKVVEPETTMAGKVCVAVHVLVLPRFKLKPLLPFDRVEPLRSMVYDAAPTPDGFETLRPFVAVNDETNGPARLLFAMLLAVLSIVPEVGNVTDVVPDRVNVKA